MTDPDAKRGRGRPRIGPTLAKSKAAAMAAAGATHEEVGRAIGVTRRTIERWLSEDESREIVSRVRRTLRARTAEDVAEARPYLHSAIMKVLQTDQLDPKAVDALTRAALNLEKVAASASGENGGGKQSGTAKLEVVFPQWMSTGSHATVIEVESSPAEIIDIVT